MGFKYSKWNALPLDMHYKQDSADFTKVAELLKTHYSSQYF